MQPDWMNRVSPVVFTTWAMRGLNDLILRERGLDAIALPDRRADRCTAP